MGEDGIKESGLRELAPCGLMRNDTQDARGPNEVRTAGNLILTFLQTIRRVFHTGGFPIGGELAEETSPPTQRDIIPKRSGVVGNATPTGRQSTQNRIWRYFPMFEEGSVSEEGGLHHRKGSLRLLQEISLDRILDIAAQKAGYYSGRT